MEQKIFTGYNCCQQLFQLLNDLRPESIFLVTGKIAFDASGAKEKISPIINQYTINIFTDFGSNPNFKSIQKGIVEFNQVPYSVIIAIGGGSVIDMAKSIAILHDVEGDIRPYIRGERKLQTRHTPLIVMPTTAGTGSESTHFAVVYIDKKKYSLEHNSILPDYAFLEPAFTERLPPYITACTGMDALCQSIEAYWSIHSTNESREYSKKAIRLCLENLFDAVQHPRKNSRENMILASNFSGKAINIAKTTAAHAASYPITLYFHVPHGHAVALTLPHFIKFNAEITAESCQDHRGVHHVKNTMKELLTIFQVTKAVEATNLIITLMHSIGLSTSLQKLGISEKNHEIICKYGLNPQRIKNNPRIVTEQDLKEILQKII